MGGEAGGAVGVGDVLVDADGGGEHPGGGPPVPVRPRVGVDAEQSERVTGGPQPDEVRFQRDEFGAVRHREQQPGSSDGGDAGRARGAAAEPQGGQDEPVRGGVRRPQFHGAGGELGVDQPSGRGTGAGGEDAVGGAQDAVERARAVGETGDRGDGSVAAGGEFALGGEEAQGVGRGAGGVRRERGDEDGVGGSGAQGDPTPLGVGERRVPRLPPLGVGELRDPGVPGVVAGRSLPGRGAPGRPGPPPVTVRRCPLDGGRFDDDGGRAASLVRSRAGPDEGEGSRHPFTVTSRTLRRPGIAGRGATPPPHFGSWRREGLTGAGRLHKFTA